MTALEALLIVIIASLFIAIGLTALAVSLLRGLSRDRMAPLFGVFVLLYGIRLMVKSPLLREAIGLAGEWHRFIEDWITYAIPGSAAMFMEVIAAPAYRSILRRVWQADFIYAALAIVADIAVHRHGSALWMNPVVVILNFAIGTVSMIGSTRSNNADRSDRRSRGGMIAAIIGASIFAALAAYETVFRHSPFAHTYSLEPVGMLAFILGLGYFVAERAIERERRLLSLSQELETARKIQQSILPASTPSTPELEIVAHYLPMAEVAGDFYDFMDRGDGKLGVLVADVSGHGVPAAIIASMVKIALAAQADHADNPALVIAGMNHALCGKFELAYVTAAYAFLDPTRRTLTYASAGHPPLLLHRAGGEIESLEEGGLVLGFNPDAAYSTASVNFYPGDRLLLYTDGLLEATDSRGAFYGDARLAENLRAGAGLKLTASVAHIIDDLNAWQGRGMPLTDDVTIVAVALHLGVTSTHPAHQ
jgi:sigma-B regulation protein RsbU (phosphoserine phosphatase)